MDIEILCDFPAEYAILDGNNAIRGVVTKDKGINKSNDRKDEYEPGMSIMAKQTILCEGARGSITENVIEQFNLRSTSNNKYNLSGRKIMNQT